MACRSSSMSRGDLLLGGAVLQRLLQRLPRGVQPLLGVRHVAVLDGARHRQR